jgi:hypothetical protein
MKRRTVRLLASGMMVMIGAQFAQAYDAHHPDPMSILNGKIHRKRTRKPPPVIKQDLDITLPPRRMYQKRKEGKYVLRPEPYSIRAGKDDPELLGPQRTYVVTSPSAAGSAASASVLATASSAKVHAAIPPSRTAQNSGKPPASAATPTHAHAADGNASASSATTARPAESNASASSATDTNLSTPSTAARSADSNATAQRSRNMKSTAPDSTASSSSVMSRDECIALIGKATFDRYVEKFGTQEGALRRCLIFKRRQ